MKLPNTHNSLYLFLTLFLSSFMNNLAYPSTQNRFRSYISYNYQVISYTYGWGHLRCALFIYG